MEDDSKNKVESKFTIRRILELKLNPVKGNFDIAHLKEINRRIFQDLPGYDIQTYKPGEFRPVVSEGNDWIKSRHLKSIDEHSYVAYSRMDKTALAKMEQLLKTAEPAKLCQFNKNEFSQYISQLYVNLDYIHPFLDGNSRTLREFTRQLADESGYSIPWEVFNNSNNGRDVLYIARDLSVNKLALPEIANIDTKQKIVFTLDKFDGNSELPELLSDIIHSKTQEIPEAEKDDDELEM